MTDKPEVNQDRTRIVLSSVRSDYDLGRPRDREAIFQDLEARNLDIGNGQDDRIYKLSRLRRTVDRRNSFGSTITGESIDDA